jgi:hypothetical protein
MTMIGRGLITLRPKLMKNRQNDQKSLSGLGLKSVKTHRSADWTPPNDFLRALL